MRSRLADRLLQAQLAIRDRVDRATASARARLARIGGDDSGQTSTEYLMISGLMAAAIITILVTFFWGTIRDAAANWAHSVHDAVLGGAMK